jgi:GLPGLI family protein
MNKPRVCLVILVTVLFSSCGGKSNRKEINCGRIDYKITYLNDNLDKKMLEILPKRMKLIFNQKEAINNIEGFLGFYKLEALTNFHSRKCSTVLKVIDKNYLYKGKHDEMMCCFNSMDEMVITETQETKNIAGFNCHKAIIYLPSNNSTFDIYYTGEINLKRPNSTNPYRKINGVLMEFELNLLHLHMRFSAEKFQPIAEIPEEYAIPKSARTIDRDEMTKILNKLLE